METYTTNLSIDECRQRLRQKRGGFFDALGIPVRGREQFIFVSIWGRRFWLTASMRPHLRNSFRPVFWGRLAPTDSGTSIIGRFHMGWFFAIPVAGLLVYLSQPSWSLGEAIIFCTILASVCGIAYFFNRIAVREEELIRRFIRETLDAS